MNRHTLFLTILAIVLMASFLIYQQKETPIYKPGSSAELDTAVNQAKHAYQLQKAQGKDFASGPCLSNDLLPDWVADVVHTPRQSVDDLAQNQCPAFLEGRANRFVELDLDGNVVRVK